MDITLYYCAKTRAVRIRWLLEELSIPYQLEHIDIFSGAGQTKKYRDIHPYGQVPAIKIDDELIFESGAICNVLADKFPEKAFAPKLNTIDRAQYEQWMFFAPATLEPPIFQYLLHTSIFSEQRRVPQIAELNIKSFRQILNILEKIFQEKMLKKNYLVNDTFSCADIMIGSVLFWAPEFVSKYTELSRYTENLRSRKPYQKALLND
ncbi:MAG: glutathione S-transferase family protein [Thiohalomonadales bacterium]